MAREAHKTILQRVIRLISRTRTDERDDGCLLARFSEQHDEAAFAALMERHGPMVLGVCRRVLGPTPDAEDAFQATFMVLLRRASALDRRATVGAWLYTVAYHIALRARGHAARRRLRESEAAQRERAEPMDETSHHDLRATLDLELSRLPEKYRAPLVLCYLQGMTNEEAARLLGWTHRSVTNRLARARQLLQDRLGRRGLAVAGTALASALAEIQAAVPVGLSERTMQAALAGAAMPGLAATLTEETLRTMYTHKLKMAAAIFVTAGLVASVGGMFLSQHRTGGGDKSAERELVGRQSDEPKVDPVRSLTHGGRVMALAFSPDGKSLVSAGYAVRLWDVAGAREIRPFGGPGIYVDSVAFSPNGALLATGGAYGDNTVRLWDVTTGKELHKLTGHDGGVNSVAFSPDGSALASGSYKTGQVFVWDVTQGKMLRRLVGKPVPGPINIMGQEGLPAPFASVSWSAQGSVLASGDLYGGVRLWDTKSWTELRSFRGRPGGIFTHVRFVGDSRTLASWADDSFIYLWNTADGTALRTIASPQNQILHVASSPDGRMLASVGEGSTVYLWETASGQKRSGLAAEGNTVTAADFSPDGRFLAAADIRGTIRLWDVDRQAKAVEPTAERLGAWWSDLADTSGQKAYKAMQAFTLAGEPAVAYLDKQLTPVPKAAIDKVPGLVADLGAADFATRNRAAKELERLGDLAEAAVTEKLASKPDLELTKRLEQLLATLERERRTPSAAWLQQDRALEVLERVGSVDARGVLKRLADGAAGARLTRQAAAALARLDRRLEK